MSLIIDKEDLEGCNMKTRILTALLILACVIPPLLLGGIWINLLIAFIIIAGGLELLNLTEHKGSWPFIIKPFAMLCVFVLSYGNQKLSVALLGIFVLVFLSIPVFTDTFHAKDGFLCISYITFFYMIAKSFMHIYDMNRMYVWLIIVATYVCDTGAYFCGRFLGKHKLNERISPKKTWEGAIGGWIFGAALSFAFAYFLIPDMRMNHILLASVVMPITGQIGDLAFSAIKRCFKIKDFSDLLPGHGGVLDRVDSLVFNFICFDFILVVLSL